VAVDFDGKESAWMQLFHIIREQFPYSKMRGLKVRDGAVVSFETVQYTFIFGRGMETPPGLLPGTFDEQWQRLLCFCRSLQNGTVGEVHFTDGRPVLVSLERPGMNLTPQGFASARKGGEASRELIAA